MPTAKELADPSIEHFPIFDDPAFIQMMTEDVSSFFCILFDIQGFSFGILIDTRVSYIVLGSTTIVTTCSWK